MYRLVIFLLSIFSVTLLVLIVSGTLWRDYRAHQGISVSRAFDKVIPGAVEPIGSSPGTRGENRAEAFSGPSTISPELLAQVQSEFLYLINSERVKAQVQPLVMGSNASAQLHAENMSTYSYRSHWDVHGLTSQMRYTLAGGTNRMSENIAGPVSALPEGTSANGYWREIVGMVHNDFLQDPEGRANLLDPWHRKVSVGFACDPSNCWIVQQFESDHISFSELPTIRGGAFRTAGELDSALELDGLVVWFHPNPRQLSLGQLDATYHYGFGQAPATFIRPPPMPDQYYPFSLASYHWGGGIDPYTLESGLARSAAPPLRIEVSHSAAVPWTTATRWEQIGQSFLVEADLSSTVGAYGPGVYTVQVWGRSSAARIPLTNYTVFYRR